ncbi:APC family permease [Amycolatopsis keratiniphila]|uniref:Amino acid permease n=1 Tax=Amycolatopsis keratiniphila subsp. keratiniphila TaxID=227715 RepID=A0A1W2LLE1_9PSEU|nr:APC family permease [Amycolatopsis keratiniphila]OLZ48117.1 amino acid permease [Amycolatopsis keratiniphila subsp. nogabecina]ONF63589.1 amino acid permease [Amycolatopsis keratiniphila subsp. keratiniphila]SDU26356.1 Amino acid transporter [Amycolatopsis keratiniphila]
MITTLTRPESGTGRSERHRLSVVGGLAALSLDAMASVAYGPEAIVIVLAVAGGAGLGFTLPVTLAIAVLLGVLTLSYRQVIAAFPDGGGAYGVSRTYLGRRASLVAAASLIVDYVLNVAVSVAAGVAALTSAFPGLLPYTLWLCLGVLALVTGVNLRGIAESARVFVVPTVIYVGAILTVIVAGLFRSGPAAAVVAPDHARNLQTVGVLLLLKAFANGCAALTGVEAIANAVPSFRKPRVRRAQHAEIALGGLLGVMLLGIAVLIGKFAIHPVDGVTVLSQVTTAALGDGFGFYLVQFSTVVLLALAANTSFGGLPVLAQLLAKHNKLPHVFALRAERQVYRYGVGFLAITAAVLLVITDGDMNTLVPLFAIGVFVGFTLSQVGMVRHWRRTRPSGWRGKATLNGFGALLTGAAAIVVTTTKFGEGGWLIVVALPLLVAAMEWVERSYRRIGERLGLGLTPAPPRPHRSLVIVPVHTVSRLTRDALAAALSLGDQVEAVHVVHPDDEHAARDFVADWEKWHPEVTLIQLHDERRRLGEPLVEHLRTVGDRHVFVLIAEVEPEHWWQRILQNQRGGVLARALRRRSDAVVCRMRFRLTTR